MVMPLLNGDPFVKQSPPSDLDPDEELFFSPITYEIFRDYDEFFERTILLNSTKWDCGFCEKSQLTYPEALACEKSDMDQLANFGEGLTRGLLHIVFHAKRRKLAEIVDLICAFASTRFFTGERVLLRCSNVPNSVVVKQTFMQSVIVDQVILPPLKSKTEGEKNSEDVSNVENNVFIVDPVMPDAHAIKYVVRRLSAKATLNSIDKPENDTDVLENSSMILNVSALQRTTKNHINRDRIRFFIRQTCFLENQVFTPRASLMRHFNLYPHGPLKWNDLFSNPEPRWLELTPPPANLSYRSLGSGSKPNTHSAKEEAGKNALVYSSSIDGSSRSKPRTILSAGEADSARSAKQAQWDAQRLIRNERADLERAWSLLRKRDDLELSDLIPLPDLTPVKTRLSIKDFGRALQLFEFFHVFGPLLNLPMPGFSKQFFSMPLEEVSASATKLTTTMGGDGGKDNKCRLSWEALEELLLSSDPSGAFSDVVLGMLGAIRKLENETNGRQLTPTAEAAALAAISAVATIEAGMPIACAGSLTGLGSSTEYITMYADTVGASSKLSEIFRSAGEATRDCELVGVAPFSTVTSRADKAALLMVSLGGVPVPNTVGVEESAGIGGGCVGKSLAVRAGATAAALGAASLPPLDRAGLSEALRLHIATAPAKAGGWRGGIWGGTRPLDDPCIAFASQESTKHVIDKLRNVPVCCLPVAEKLELLQMLMDELLLQPQLRDRMDEQLERLRNLRLQLRSIQSERFRLYGGNANLAIQIFGGFSPNTLVLSCDNWLTGTPPILRSQINKPRKNRQNIKVGKLSTSASSTKLNNGIGANVDSPIVIDADSSHQLSMTEVSDGIKKLEDSGKTDAADEDRSEMTSLAEDLEAEELDLWQKLFQVARNCSMIPLGQDRVHRSYWIVMSLPAVLIETTDPLSPLGTDSASTSTPAFHVRSQQVPTSLMGLGSSSVEAAERLEEAIDTLLTAPLEDVHWQNPGILDRDSLVSQLAIDLPLNREKFSLEELRSLVYPVHRGKDQTDASHPAVVQVGNFFSNTAPRWSILLPAPLEEISIKSGDNDDHRYERARLAVTRLEASLNPRGCREGRLRKSVSQLRPVIIQAVADCPVDRLTSTAFCEKQDDIVDKTEAIDNATQHVLYSWLEASVQGVASRLGRYAEFADAFRDLSPSFSCKKEEEEEEEKSRYPIQPINMLANGTHIKREQDHFEAVNSKTLDDCSGGSHLQRIADILLGIATSIGSNCLAAPLSNDEKSARSLHTSNSAASLLLASESANEMKMSDEEALSVVTPAPQITTGWQRWCAAVRTATSTSQLHLLARALERSARRGHKGGRGVPAAISAVAGRFRLPQLRCSACFGMPDVVRSAVKASTSSTTTPFSICGGCASPYHLDCLINSRSRCALSAPSSAQRSARPRPLTPFTSSTAVTAPSTLVCFDGLPPLASVVGTYTLLTGQLGSVVANRQDVLATSLLLCDRCKRLAGYEGVLEFVAPRPLSTLSDTQSEAGGDDEDVEIEDGDAESIKSHVREEVNEADCRVSQPPLQGDNDDDSDPNKPKVKHNSSVIRVSRGRGRPPRSSLTGKRKSKVGRGRPPKKARQLSSEEEEEEEEEKVFLVTKEEALVTDSVIYDDEEEAFETVVTSLASRKSNRESKHLMVTPSRSPAVKKQSAGRRSSVAANSSVGKKSQNPPPQPSTTCAAEFGLNCQLAAERFLAEITNLSFARPLVRCAPLSRALTGEETLIAGGGNGRTRSEVIYAYDLEGLKDLLTRRVLPAGPGEVVSQLRLLIKHWLNSNRPGSRLFGCATDMSTYVERRLVELREQNNAPETPVLADHSGPTSTTIQTSRRSSYLSL